MTGAGLVAAMAVAGAVYALATRGRRVGGIHQQVAAYLTVRRPQGRPAAPSRLERAGLRWTKSEFAVRRAGFVVAGLVTGALLASGDLFLTPVADTAPLIIALGGTMGWLLHRMHVSSRAQQRLQRLRSELPGAAELLAIHVLAGESVPSAVERTMRSTLGVVAEDLQTAIAEHQAGLAFFDAMKNAGRRALDADAGRLYSALALAHVTGGPLHETLLTLAGDYRDRLQRDLTEESGRRAVAGYAPVLALMVPVTLLFLVFPALAGLRSLASP